MKRIALAGLVLLLFVSLSLTAQEITGTIVGNVKDASGSVVPNATVTVTNTDRNQLIRTVKTDASGDYVAPLLPIGHYKVEVNAQGFKKVAQTSIELNVNDRFAANFSLQVGSSEQVVNVEANALQVETQTATATGLVTGVEVRQLSLNNRNYEQLVALMPGVTYGGGDQLYIGTTNPFGSANTVSFSINGARNSSNNWTVDGADNVDRGSNLTLLNYPSVDAIAEFKVLRGLYSPEFGRGAGQVNVVTSSGTSGFHGDAYEFWRNNAIAANDYFRKRSANTFTKSHPAPLRYNNFGYTIGGPVFIPGVYNEKKDKTFFFFSEEFRRVITYSTLTATLPTAAEKGGTMPFNTCIAFNATRSSCTQVLPANTPITNFRAIDPIAAAYIKDIWANAPAPDDAGTNSAALSFRNVLNHRQELVRIDHTFSPKLNIFGRYLQDKIPTEEPFGLFGPNSTIPGVATSSTNSPGKSWVFRATYSATSNILIDGGYNYSYGAITSDITGAMNPANSPDVATLTKSILPFTPTLARIPSVSNSVFSSIGGFGPYRDFNRDYNEFGSLSWLKGKHNYKFGATFHNYSKTENAGGNNTGTYSFDSTGADTTQACPAGLTTTQCTARIRAAQQWANFLTGTASQYQQIAQDLTPYIRMHQFEGFAQDEWRILPRLTFSYGVRYSYFPQPYNDNTQVLSNFDPSQYNPANAPLVDPTTGNIVIDAAGNPTKGSLTNGIIYASGSLKNSPYGAAVGKGNSGNWAPRIGFAWDPFGDGKTSVRTGYGIFYQATLVGTYEQAMFGNPPFSSTLTITGNSTTGQFPTFANPSGGVASISAVPKSLRGVQVTGDTPYTQQWSLDVQHELPDGFLLDVGYYGSKDTHLLGIVDLNQPTPGAWVGAGISGCTIGGNPVNGLCSTNIAKINAIRPYLGYSSINTIRPWFTGNYNSLQFSGEKRFKNASLFKLNYTWSHALTTNMSDRSNAPANVYDLMQNYGPSALDRRHVITANYIYELPWMHAQKGFTGHLLGGWQTSGIVSIATGLPLNVSGNLIGGSSVDPAGQGCISSASSCPIRPNQIGDPNVSAPHLLGAWFNTAAFAANNTAGAVGSSNSGAIRGPGYWRVDASIFKEIRMTERVGMQLRLETFNALNHENFNTVNTSFGGSLFGQITASRDPRLVQLGAKFHF